MLYTQNIKVWEKNRILKFPNGSAKSHIMNHQCDLTHEVQSQVVPKNENENWVSPPLTLIPHSPCHHGSYVSKLTGELGHKVMMPVLQAQVSTESSSSPWPASAATEAGHAVRNSAILSCPASVIYSRGFTCWGGTWGLGLQPTWKGLHFSRCSWFSSQKYHEVEHWLPGLEEAATI